MSRVDARDTNPTHLQLRRALHTLKGKAFETLVLMTGAEKSPALLAIPVSDLEIFLAIHAHSFKALIARVGVTCHLFAILATLLFN